MSESLYHNPQTIHHKDTPPKSTISTMDGLRAPGINGRGVGLVVVSLTFLGVAALMVGVRVATKRALRKLWERDDWLILAALVSISHYRQSF